jgi:hypothetical protein
MAGDWKLKFLFLWRLLMNRSAYVTEIKSDTVKDQWHTWNFYFTNYFVWRSF